MSSRRSTRRNKRRSLKRFGKRRDNPQPAVTTHHENDGVLFNLEQLEQRLLLSVSVYGVPVWEELGASPELNASTVSVPNSPSSGGVEDLAIDPSDPGRMFAGTINGGIWVTTNGDRPFDGIDNDGANGVDDPAEQPTWTPLTDQYASLSIGDIRFDPLDATNNTLFAGTGSASSLATRGGVPIGVMRTDDGGLSWSVTPLNPGNEPRVRAVLPTTIDYSGATGVQQVVFVGTANNADGMYRSTDGGENYTNISGLNGLPNGPVTDLLVDPNNASTVYAAVVGAGVFFTSDGGDSWTATNNANLTGIGSSTVVQLTAHAGGGTTQWYTLVSGPAPAVFTSNDGGTNWTALAATPAGFTSNNNNLYTSMAADQIVVDPSNSAVVYIAKGYGGSPHMYRYNPSGSGSWVQIENVAATSNTRPHVDHRDLKFAGNNLITANDGGLYFLNNPINPGGNPWTSLHGIGATGLSATEFTNVAWDSTFDVAYGGAQDNGTLVQNGFLDPVWTSFRGADGGDAAVDTVNAGPGQTFRYTGTQPPNANPQQLPLNRHTFNSATNEVVAAVSLYPAAGLAGLTPYFVPLYELNTADPSRLVVGGSGTSPVYELLNAATATGVGDANWQAVPVGAGFGNVNNNNDAPIVYGGRLGGVDNPEVLIVGSGNRVFVRSTAGGTLTATPMAFPGGTVRGVAVDPEDWMRMFVTDGSGVWETTDAGTTWTNISRNLAEVNSRIQSIAFVPTATDGTVVVGGNLGVSRLPLYYTDSQWTRLGGNIPNALVSDLSYDATDDVLLAGTFGRGAWLLQNVQSVVEQPSALVINGDMDFAGQDDRIVLSLDENNPLILNVTVNGTAFGPYVIDTFDQITVNGLGGNDTLLVDHSNGLVVTPGGIRFDGGSGSDLLQQIASDGADAEYSVGPDIGAGVVTLDDGTSTSTTFFFDLEPVEIYGGGAGTTLTVNATNSVNAINYTQGPNSNDGGHGVFMGDTTGIITIDTFESLEFSNYENVVLNALAGDDTINLNNSTAPSSLETITVNGDDDTAGDLLIINGVSATTDIDTATGAITGASGPSVTIRFDSIEALTAVAGGSSTLAVSGSSDYIVNPGLAPDDGTILTSALPIRFFGFGAGDTLGLDGTGDLIIFGTDANDTFTVASTSGDVAIAGRATIERYGSLTDLFLNGLDGDDVFNVTGAQPYSTISLAGGNPSASDQANLTGDGSAVTVDLGDPTPTVTGGGLGTVNLTGIELLSLSAVNAGVAIRGTNDDDLIRVSKLGADNGTVQANGLAPILNFNGATDFAVDLLDGDDVLEVSGSTDADEITVMGTSVAITGKLAVDYSNAESLIVNGLQGSDTIDVTPSAIPVFIDGGDPVGVVPGDLLIVQAGGGTATINAGPEPDEGSVEIDTNGPVSFDHIESLAIDGAGGAVINGTNGPDAITIIARDDSTHGGADGVQDFTSSVNDGLEVLWLNTPMVTVNALGGSDEIVLRTPAPNNVDWDTDVIVDGGSPSASDRLVVETPGDAAESVVYSPTADGEGTMAITEFDPAKSTIVTINGIEELVYDGESDNDSLIVVGTAGDDTTTHTPGTDDWSGRFQVNTLLALDYQNLGAGASLLSDGWGGTDTLAVYGTEVADTFSVDPTGQVGLNTRLAIDTANTQRLQLEGLHGNDLFDLPAPISLYPFNWIGLNGGTQSSPLGDQANLHGTAGDESFTVSGQSVSLGGVTVVGDGIENTNLDGDGGTDTLMYTGVDGVDDNVSIVAANEPNAGMIDVAGVAHYTYTGVGVFEVRGNLGNLGDTDTVTVAGTNNDDTFDVNMDAVGIVAEPVLKLFDHNGDLLLILTNYLNIPTLNMDSREGGDVFNVWTGFDQSRQIFLDGGLPEGKKRQRPADRTDDLNVFYERKRPNITHNTETQDPDSGIVDLFYNNGERSLVQYLNIEDVTISFDVYVGGNGGSDNEQPLAGDLNSDGFVGIDDLNTVLSNWNQNVPAGAWNVGDPSGDGFVGIEDLNIVLGNWNAGTPPLSDAETTVTGTLIEQASPTQAQTDPYNGLAIENWQSDSRSAFSESDEAVYTPAFGLWESEGNE